MDEKQEFDFWYAVNNTDVRCLPSSHLETFGNTIINYFLIAELMDSVNQIRVREGRLQAMRPQIIAPSGYSKTILEGFGDKAQDYVEWLRTHEQQVQILQYGYTLKQESFNEHVISDQLENVVDKITGEVESSADPMAAVLVGVDEPWDVCLVKMFWEIIQNSAAANITEMRRHQLFENINGLPRGVRQDIDEAFKAASMNKSLIKPLAALLNRHDVFEEYQDRFFSLCRRHGGG